MKIPEDKLRFLKWNKINYTENNLQVGNDDKVISGKSAVRTEPTNSDSTTIYVSLDGDDSDAGTSSAPVRTLDQAFSLLTSAKTQIIITDSGTYDAPLILNASNYSNIVYFSGIYAATGETPTIRDNKSYEGVYTTGSGAYVELYHLMYNDGFLYFIEEKTGTNIKLVKVNIYDGTDTSYSITGTTSNTVLSAQIVPYLGWIRISLDDQTFRVFDISAGTFSTDSSPTFDSILSSYISDTDIYTYALEQDTSGEVTLYITDCSSIYNSRDTYVEEEVITDFIEVNNFLYVFHETKVYGFELYSSTGINPTLTEISETSVTSFTNLALKSRFYVDNGKVYFPTLNGLYLCENGNLTIVSTEPVARHVTTKNYIIATLQENTIVCTRIIRSTDITLIGAGETYSAIDMQVFHYTDGIIHALGPSSSSITYPEVLYRIQNCIFDIQYSQSEDTLLLIKCEESVVSGAFTESGSTGHTVTEHGTSITQNSSVKYVGSSSYEFTSSGTDYLSIPDHSDFDLGTSDFSIGFAFKLKTTTGSQTFFDFGNAIASNEGIALWMVSGASLRLHVNSGASTDYNSYTITPDTDWHFVDIVRNGGYVKLYYDGVEIIGSKGATWLRNVSVNVSTDLLIGKYASGSNYLNGYLDHFYFTKKALFTTAHSFLEYPMYISTSFDYGTLNIQGLKLYSRYAENGYHVINKYQKVKSQYNVYQDFYVAVKGSRHYSSYDWFENCQYIIYSDDVNYNDTTGQMYIFLGYSVMKNTLLGMYINEDTDGYEVRIGNCTFQNFGQFDVNIDDSSCSLYFTKNVLSGCYNDDYGTMYTTRSYATLTGNLYDEVINVDLDGKLTTITGINENAFFVDYNNDLRIRRHELGYHYSLINNIYGTSSEYCGAYYQSYTSTNSDTVYYDLPKPDNVIITSDFVHKTSESSIDGTHRRETTAPIIKFKLTWDDTHEMSIDDYYKIRQIMESDEFFEVFLDGLLTGTFSTDHLSDSSPYSVVSGLTPNKLWIGRLVTCFTATYQYGIVSDVIDDIVYFHDRVHVNNLYIYEDPNSGTWNEARGYICTVSPSNIDANCQIVNGLFNFSGVKQLSGFTMELNCHLNFNFEYGD